MSSACSSPKPVAIEITTGQETDAFAMDPAVTRVDVTVTSLDRSVNLKVSAAPGGTFDFGELPADEQVEIEVDGLAADGTSVMRGRSLSGLSLGGVDDKIPVFAMRTVPWQWARPDGGVVQTHVGGAAASMGERYLMLAGGTKAAEDASTPAATQADYYDVFGLAGAAPTALPRAPKTLVSIGDAVLAIGDDGAEWVDFSAVTVTTASPPNGLASFAHVTGGAVVGAGDGRTFVVGGTRSGEETRAVLEVDDDRTLSAYATTAPRKGAAATWIDGVGLVVAGGSSIGAGLEVLGDSATSFAARAGFPADPTEGAGAVTDGAQGLVLLGGVLAGGPAPTRLVDASCLAECAAQELADAALQATLAGVSAYALGASRFVVVGADTTDQGRTRAFVVDLASGPTELPLKEPRRGAVSLPTPLAYLAILGGEHLDGTPATSVEMLFTK